MTDNRSQTSPVNGRHGGRPKGSKNKAVKVPLSDLRKILGRPNYTVEEVLEEVRNLVEYRYR